MCTPRTIDLITTMKTLIINDLSFELALMAPALSSLGAEIIGQATNESEAYSLFLLHKPSVVIIDIGFNNRGAIELCQRFRETNPLLGLIIISSTPDLRILGTNVGQIPAGSQLILKSCDNVVGLIHQSIALSILAVQQEGSTIWAGQENLLNAQLFISILAGLTDIQIETLRHIGNGLSNLEISRLRFVTEKSVEQIVTKISQYFGVGADPTKNQRVLLAGHYFKWVGAIRQ